MNNISVITAKYGSLDQYQKCPPFWTPTPGSGGQKLIDSLRQARIRVIGRSAGGHEIIAIEYGAREETGATCANLASAVSALVGNADPTVLYPASFYGNKRRSKPSLCLQGAIHGGELTGTVAALNLCQIIETGRDLRGREWPMLAKLARDTRLTIIPWLNMDGVLRWPLPNGATAPRDLMSSCEMGMACDGTNYQYPAMKSIYPIPPETTAHMGSYFNDAGFNLQYDFCMPTRQPETLAWMNYYLDERPDAVLVMHGNAGTLIGVTHRTVFRILNQRGK